MLLSPYADTRETLHFEMMGLTAQPDDEHARACLFASAAVFESAYLCTVDHAVPDLILFGFTTGYCQQRPV